MRWWVPVLLVVAGCSGGGRGSGGELRDAARSHAESILSGNPNVSYRYLSKDCQASVAPGEWTEAVLGRRALAKTLAGVDFGAMTVSEVRVDELGDGRATVFIELTQDGEPVEFGGEDDGASWVHEDGWRTTECDLTDA